MNQEKILNFLLLKSSLEKDLGLFYGKMGLTIFFMKYYKHSNDKIYEETACEIFDEILCNINKNININFHFDSGLTGIGWGIEYLIQNNFLSGDTLDICEEIDNKIMEIDPRRITDFSIDKGLGGILHYILLHLKGIYKQRKSYLFDTTFLNDLYESIQNCLNKPISSSTRELCNIYNEFYKHKSEITYIPNLYDFIYPCTIKEKDIYKEKIGINKGLAGVILNSLQ